MILRNMESPKERKEYVAPEVNVVTLKQGANLLDSSPPRKLDVEISYP